MKRIGIFLGMQPTSGGVFQYSKSMLMALAALPPSQYETVALYVHPAWEPVLDELGLRKLRPTGADYGLALSKIFRAACLPGAVARALSRLANPLAWAMTAQKCDLWLFPGHDAMSYQADVPALPSIHDLMHIYEPQFPEVTSLARTQMRNMALRNEMAWSKGILTDSETGKRHVEEFCAGRPHPPIFPLPYVAAYSDAGKPPDPGFAARYGIPEKFVFYPAQFWLHKNHIRLIDAVASLRDVCPDIHLVLCGSKRNGYSEVLEHIRATNMTTHVTVTGFVPEDDLEEFYRRARGLVMPTFFGPTNIPPLEAFALGCPVAISGIYAMPEQGRDAALYFDPKSVDEMAGCIKRIWQDDALCVTLRQKGFARTAAWGQPQFNAALRDIIGRLVP